MPTDSSSLAAYHIFPKYWESLACTNIEDPDQMLQNAESDQDLHCLLLIQQFLDKSIESIMVLF